MDLVSKEYSNRYKGKNEVMKIDQSDGTGAPNVIVVERLKSRLASWAIGVLEMFGDVRYARCNTSSTTD